VEFIGALERECDLYDRILDYNGQQYRFGEGDIPELQGAGLIVVRTGPIQYQGWRGPFDNICMRQAGGISTINGVAVDELVLKMERTEYAAPATLL
jgi:hypothetical protein